MEKDPVAKMADELTNMASAKVDRAGQPLTGAAWVSQGELKKLTSWPNPTFDAVDRAPWDAQPGFVNCPCPSCVQMRQQRSTPEDMFNQLQHLHFTVRDLTAQTKTQDKQIAKLEGLVQMLVKALGVNEEFLSEAYKGAV